MLSSRTSAPSSTESFVTTSSGISGASPVSSCCFRNSSHIFLTSSGMAARMDGKRTVASLRRSRAICKVAIALQGSRNSRASTLPAGIPCDSKSKFISSIVDCRRISLGRCVWTCGACLGSSAALASFVLSFFSSALFAGLFSTVVGSPCFAAFSLSSVGLDSFCAFDCDESFRLISLISVGPPKTLTSSHSSNNGFNFVTIAASCSLSKRGTTTISPRETRSSSSLSHFGEFFSCINTS
mmetsp:Transcript_12938/g.21976  ORF Transcript_12938/g.21976 Transcript_12938/m.21976 type:complete len:240 (-) Transcript_12938:208-927(-)